MRAPAAMTAILFGGMAAAIGFACGRAAAPMPVGPTLPGAGTEADDATGLLAVLSTRGTELMKVADQGGELYGGDRYGGDDDYQDDYGYQTYDGGGFGGGTYGGALYAGYVAPVPDYYGAAATPAPRPYLDGYVETEVTDGGAIEGRVLWPGRPRAPATLATTGCGAIDNGSLRAGAVGQVAGAVVFLSDIREGRSNREAGAELPVRLGGMIERRGCALHPHIQLIQPIGATLELVNGDEDALSMSGRIWTGLSRDVMFDEPLSYRGESRSVRLDRAGFVRVRAREEVDSAWVVVAGHPYYALTDERGRFRVDGIPPGTYALTVWHEPVVTGVDQAGRAILSEPATTTRKVVVRALETTRADVNLPRVE